MLNKILIIVNPSSGKGTAEKYSKKLADVLKLNFQSQVTIRLTTQEGDAFNFAKHSLEENFDTVFCLGGDGTVSETVAGLIELEEPPVFGFIPLGTVNDLGRALGYSMNPDQAIDSLKKVSIQPLDIGKVNDRIFVNVVAIGPIAEKVMGTSSEDKNRMGKLAYIRDSLPAIFSEDAYLLHIESPQEPKLEIETSLLLVGLTNSIGGVEFMFPEASYKDGQLHLIAVKGRTPLDLIQASINIGLGNIDDQHLLKLSETSFTISSLHDQKIYTNIDGDQGVRLPLKIEVLPQAIQVIIPD